MARDVGACLIGAMPVDLPPPPIVVPQIIGWASPSYRPDCFWWQRSGTAFGAWVDCMGASGVGGVAGRRDGRF